MYRVHGYDASSYHSDAGDAVIENARILGIHNDEEILAHDIRVNGYSDDEPSIVVFDDGPGGLKAAIDVNSVESVIFRFLVPLDEGSCAADDEESRPHRIEPKRPKARKQAPFRLLAACGRHAACRRARHAAGPLRAARARTARDAARRRVRALRRFDAAAHRLLAVQPFARTRGGVAHARRCRPGRRFACPSSPTV